MCELVDYITKNYQPGTKFISLFGALDFVNDKNKYYIDQDKNVFILGKSEYRMIFNGENKDDFILSLESDDSLVFSDMWAEIKK